MTDEEQRRFAFAEAQGALAELATDAKGSFTLVAINGSGAAKKVMLGSDSEHMLAEIGKMARYLERAIDGEQINRAEDDSWAPN